MGAFNRNIITSSDAENVIAATEPKRLPRTLRISPPSGAISALALAPAGAPPPTPPAAVTAPTADDYLTKLVKYVPLEVLGAYLFMSGVIDSNVNDHSAHAWWLGGLLIAMLIITGVYDWRVLSVVRGTQIAMSVVGLAVYVFAVGGWFATTTWYHPWYASIALPLFGLLVAMVKLQPLPVPD